MTWTGSPTERLSVQRDGEAAVERAAALLGAGFLVAFPTETVYGLGALGLHVAAVQRIFAAKERPASDPLILHVGTVEEVEGLVTRVPDRARLLMATYWPGPLSLVLRRAARVPDCVTAGLDSVAVRMPAHPTALSLLRRVGAPVAAPSANLFSHTSPTTAEHVLADLDGRIEAVLDDGPTPLGVESTVLDLRGDEPVLLRPGGVSHAHLEHILGCTVCGPALVPDSAGFRSPGLLTRHYSPRTPLWLFAGQDAATLARMSRTAAGALGSVGLLLCTEDLPEFTDLNARCFDLGPRAHPEQIAHRLYDGLRTLDGAGVTAILARLVPRGGLGDAINDRLVRAAAGEIQS